MSEATDTIEKCLERIRLAWNAGDAQAYAREFAEDATYVIFLGEALLGREEIERNHIDVLTKWRKGTQMAIKAISVTSLGDDAASVLTIGGLGKGDSIPYDKLQTFTLVRRDGRWMCAAFQNNEMSRRAKRQYNATDRG
jgi:uncharacterized protein (TIGR02246 family)